MKALLQAVDMFDEKLTRGGDRFNLSLVHDWDDSVSAKVDVDDNLDGTYTCSFRMTVG